MKIEYQKGICTPMLIAELFTKPKYGNNLSVHQQMNGQRKCVSYIYVCVCVCVCVYISLHLFMYINAKNFYLLILYAATLLNSFTGCNSFLWHL